MPVAESGPVSASVPPMRTGCCARAKTLKQASAIAPSSFCSFMGPPPLRLQYDLAGTGARIDQAVRRRCLGERQHLVDQHAVAALGGRFQSELDIARQHFAERAIDSELLEVQALRVERHRAAAMRPRGHQATESREAG